MSPEKLGMSDTSFSLFPSQGNVRGWGLSFTPWVKKDVRRNSEYVFVYSLWTQLSAFMPEFICKSERTSSLSSSPRIQTKPVLWLFLSFSSLSPGRSLWLGFFLAALGRAGALMTCPSFPTNSEVAGLLLPWSAGIVHLVSAHLECRHCSLGLSQKNYSKCC